MEAQAGEMDAQADEVDAQADRWDERWSCVAMWQKREETFSVASPCSYEGLSLNRTLSSFLSLLYFLSPIRPKMIKRVILAINAIWTTTLLLLLMIQLGLCLAVSLYLGN